MEENELMNQMWEEFDELTGWRDIDSRPMFKASHDNLTTLKTLLEVREALKEVE